MLGGNYFYNGSIKKIVAVFGTIFNNISVARLEGGKMVGISRVPLAYGPRERFLARVPSNDINDPVHVAIKMPRMSFEITSMGYDSASKLNRLNSIITHAENGTATRTYQSTPYKIGFQLSILAHHQDDALQIFEQIVPYFNPEYSVTVKDLEGENTLTDIPITLTSTSFSDDYEGDFQSSNRKIIYTLDFDVKVKFIGEPLKSQKYIQYIDNIYNNFNETVPLETTKIALDHPLTDTPENYTATTTFGFL